MIEHVRNRKVEVGHRTVGTKCRLFIFRPPTSKLRLRITVPLAYGQRFANRVHAYTIIIGLEVHVQLLTESKLFCGCSTQFGAAPNTQTCPVCIGMPGTLPVMNREAFELALKTAVALELRDRPVHQVGPQAVLLSRPAQGLPDQPVRPAAQLTTASWRSAIPKGRFEPKRIGIIRAHLEEDAGKSMHDEAAGKADSRIDLNRTGTPLLEIVSAARHRARRRRPRPI